MGTDQNMNALFNHIKPITIAIARSPQVKEIRMLCQKLSEINDDHLQKVQQYCLFPLGLMLKRRSEVSESVLLAGLDCMTRILERTRVGEKIMFHDLFASINLVIDHTDNTRGSVCEEIFLSAVNCLIILLKRTFISGSGCGIYEIEFMPACGHCVSLLLSLAEKHRSRDVQCAATRALMELTSVNEKDVEARRHIGRFVASFLPGMTMTLTRIVTGDQKQGHQVLQLGVRCWALVVALVLDDRFVPCQSEGDKSLGRTDNEDLQRLLVTRNGTWLEMTVEKLNVLIDKMAALASHAQWDVRHELVVWSRTLLDKCWKSLAISRRSLLDVCITLANDVYGDVAISARDVISDVRARVDDVTVVTLLEDHLYDLCTALPRLIRMQGEEANVSTLGKLLGYIQLLGADLSPLLCSSAHVQRLYESLLQIAEIDVTGIGIVEERGQPFSATTILTDDLLTSLPVKPRPYFKYLYEDSLYRLVVDICRTIAEYGNADLLLDLCMGTVHSSPVQRKEAMFLANHFVTGAKNVKTEEEMDYLVRLVVGEYLQPDLLDVTIDDDDRHLLSREDPSQPIRNQLTIVTRTGFQSKSLRRLNSDIQQLCLLLEGLAQCAKAIGPRFQIHLMDVLYHVLICLGSSQHVVSQTAQLTLLDLAHACGYSCVNELVCENADYLVNTIALRMRHFTSDPRSPDVLRVMLDVCDVKLLLLVRDVITEILTSLDDYYVEHSARFLRVLRSLLRAILRWYQTPATGGAEARTTPVAESVGTTSINQRLLDYIRQYRRDKKIAESCQVDEVTVDEVAVDEVAVDEDEDIVENDAKKEKSTD